MKQITILLSSLFLALLFNACASKPILKQYVPEGKDNTVHTKTKAAKNDPFVQEKPAQSSTKEQKKLLKKAGKKDKAYLIPIYYALQEREYNNALSQIESLDYTYPNNEDLYYLEGLAYLKKNHLSKALNSFNKCIAINQNRGDAIFYKSFVLKKLDRFGAALSAINKAINIDDTPSLLVYQESLSNKGNNWTEEGREAILYFTRATIYKSLMQYDIALDDINKAISISPKEDYYYYGLKGQIYFITQEYSVAYKNLQKAISINSNEWGPWNLMGTIDLYSGKHYQAIKHFKKADELNFESSDSSTNLGLAYWLAGERNMALESMGAAIVKKPNADLYFHLANFHHIMKNKAQAGIFFKKAQQLEPNILSVRTNLSKMPPQDSPLYAFYKEEIKAAKKYN